MQIDLFSSNVKYLFFLIIFFSTLTGQVFSQNDPRKIAGAYQWCPFPCETFRLKTDFTFDYLINGDLFNNERAKGTWEFVGSNKIHLKSADSKLIYQVTEAPETNFDMTIIQTADIVGGVLPGVIVKVPIRNQNNEKQFVTDENGNCLISKTSQLTFSWLKDSEIYNVKNPQTAKLTVLIDRPIISIDRTFLVEIGKFLKAFDNNMISDDSYKKLSEKRIHKLFPNK